MPWLKVINGKRALLKGELYDLSEKIEKLVGAELKEQSLAFSVVVDNDDDSTNLLVGVDVFQHSNIYKGGTGTLDNSTPPESLEPIWKKIMEFIQSEEDIELTGVIDENSVSISVFD